MTRLTLAARLDLPAAEPLLATLLARRGAALEVDAGSVNHLGTLCLQVLLAAAEDWRARGNVLSVAPVSDAFATALRTFGVSLDALRSPAAETAPPHNPIQEGAATWA